MISVILLSTAVAWLLWAFFQFKDERRLRRRLPAGSRLPPMPPASSIRGHVELLRRDFYWKKCSEWTKKYGPVIRLKINFRDVVVLNDYNSIKKFWNTNEILRPWPSVVGYSDRYKGLNQMRGEAWTANRKLCVSLLKDLGFAKTATEGRMMEEFRHVADSVAQTNGKPVNTLQYVAPCVFNNVVSFFYGDQLKHDKWTVRKLHRLMVQLVGALFRGRVQHYLPWRLRRLLVRIPFTQSHEVADMLAELDAVSAKQVQQSKAAKSGDDTKGFIHGYIKKIEESRDESVPLITDGYLVGNVNVFLMGGTITLTATLMWHMLNFARNPDTVQARVQREIDEVVGDQRLPTWEDRKQMPYTVACIWELFRWRTVAPLGVSRACAADVVVGDFFIPKDAILLANIWAIHNDPTLWSEPNKFMPERHLDEEGRLISQKPEYVLPFAIGRRDCPGQTFATMEIFFLITFLLQKYRIMPEHPIELDLDSPGTPLSYANNVKLRFLPRKSSKD